MRVRAEGMRELIVPLDRLVGETDKTYVRVCGDVVRSCQPSLEAAEWFSTFLGVLCQLHRYAIPLSPSSAETTSSRHVRLDHAAPVPILLSNESPFSLISQSSVDTINSWIISDKEESDGSGSTPIHPSCFRANFTISSSPPSISHTSFSPFPSASSSTSSSVSNALPPFREDTLDLLRIGTQTFQVLARCRRCLMICVDQSTGVRMKEPYCCLAKHRQNGKRRIEFGVHLMWRGDLSVEGNNGVMRVEVGDSIVWI